MAALHNKAYAEVEEVLSRLVMMEQTVPGGKLGEMDLDVKAKNCNELLVLGSPVSGVGDNVRKDMGFELRHLYFDLNTLYGVALHSYTFL